MVVPNVISIGSVTFHLYGLILGVASVVVIKLVSVFATRNKILIPQIELYIWAALISAVIGARAWHLVTDWRLYQHAALVDVVSVWNGGVSIFGAVIGVCVSIVAVRKLQAKYLLAKNAPLPKLLQLLDLFALSVPLGQAIGRLGNFVNQELYGLPTTLPWGFEIDPSHRLEPYSEFRTFHPLFAYESIFMVLFFVFLVWKTQLSKSAIWKIGSGQTFVTYIYFYSSLRFFLDFIRIHAAPSGIWVLSSNQVALICICLGTYLFRRYIQKEILV